MTGLKEKRFSSQRKATVALGLNKKYISECLHGLRPEAGGYGWQYASGN